MMYAPQWFLSIAAVVLSLGSAMAGKEGPQGQKASPLEQVAYAQGDLKIDISYSRPGKKGREIFGGLVPYGEVWRTGANQPTTFTTNQDLTIAGKTLPAGKYTLWTIPGRDQWRVIFNKKRYNWGINMEGKASRDPDEDALEIPVPVEALPQVQEQFTIVVEDGPPRALVLSWDRTKVVVPLQ